MEARKKICDDSSICSKYRSVNQVPSKVEIGKKTELTKFAILIELQRFLAEHVEANLWIFVDLNVQISCNGATFKP